MTSTVPSMDTIHKDTIIGELLPLKLDHSFSIVINKLYNNNCHQLLSL